MPEPDQGDPDDGDLVDVAGDVPEAGDPDVEEAVMDLDELDGPDEDDIESWLDPDADKPGEL
jgi:hypothetical protein